MNVGLSITPHWDAVIVQVLPQHLRAGACVRMRGCACVEWVGVWVKEFSTKMHCSCKCFPRARSESPIWSSHPPVLVVGPHTHAHATPLQHVSRGQLNVYLLGVSGIRSEPAALLVRAVLDALLRRAMRVEKGGREPPWNQSKLREMDRGCRL